MSNEPWAGKTLLEICQSYDPRKGLEQLPPELRDVARRIEEFNRDFFAGCQRRDCNDLVRETNTDGVQTCPCGRSLNRPI